MCASHQLCESGDNGASFPTQKLCNLWSPPCMLSVAPSPEVSEQWLAVASEASTTSFTLVYFAGTIMQVKVVHDAGICIEDLKHLLP